MKARNAGKWPPKSSCPPSSNLPRLSLGTSPVDYVPLLSPVHRVHQNFSNMMQVTGQLQSSYATVQLQCSYPSLGKLLPTLHFLLPLLPILLCHFQVPWPVFHLNFGSDFSVVYTSAEEDPCHRTKSRSGEVGACALLKWFTVIGKFI